MEEVEDELEIDIQSGGHPVRDERKHRQLIDAISSLDGKKSHRLSQRTVLSNNISEFNFASSKGGGSRVNLKELVGILKETASETSLKRQLSSVDKKKLLVSEPLHKHEKQKIDRSVAYEKTSADVTKWDPIVHKNRESEQLQFPLQKQDFRVVTTTELVKRFQPRTPLEVQVAALLNGSDNVIKHPKQTLTPAEQRALRAMDINDAKERRQELMKHRALLSYKEARAKWQKKIKSKRYHRILKKDKLKKEEKQLGELAQNDPEEYLERLKTLEKNRVEERHTQKHRGGSKFGRRQMMYAKYDDRAREQVQEMIRKNKELTQKLEAQSDSEGVSEDEVGFPDIHDDDDVADGAVHAGKGSNPWMAKPSIAKPQGVTRPPAFSQQTEDENDAEDDINENDDEQTGEHSEKADRAEESMDQEDLPDTDEDAGTDIVEKSSKIENVKSKKRKKTNKFENVMTSVKKLKSNDSSEAKNSVDEIFERVENAKSRRMKKKEKDKKRQKKRNKSKAATSEDKTFEMESKMQEDLSSSEGHEEESGDESLITESLSRKKTLGDLENMSDVKVSDEIDPKKTKVNIRKEVKQLKKKVKQLKSTAPKAAYVDPNKLFQLESRMTSVGSGPDIVDNGDDDDIDPNEQQRMTIAQAFADDDVIEQFKEDKEDAANKTKPKDIDLSLPGWGSWGGDGIKPKRRKKFIIKAPPPLPRRDQYLGNVIINEDKTAAARKHQVTRVPFPFKNVQQFEKSIRVPIGQTWNPEATFKAMTKPKIVTHLGQVITPIDKSEVSKFQQKKVFQSRDSDKTEEKNVFKPGDSDTKKQGGEKKPVFKHKRNINKKHNKKRN